MAVLAEPDPTLAGRAGRRGWGGFLLLAALGLALLAATACIQPPRARVTTYVDGLLNPRGLAFDQRGVLYVAEAGAGGSRKVTVDGNESFSIGMSGRVSRVPAAGQRETVDDGLPSIHSERHGDFLGPAGVAFIGDDLYVLLASGWCREPEYDNAIVRYRPDGTKSVLFDYSQQTIADPPLARREDPRADVPGGVPYGFVAFDNHLYTTDGNLEFVQELNADARPTRRLLEYPLSIHVLTEITAGPDGALYIAEMGFWPYPEGSGRVTRLTLDGQASPVAGGVTASLGVTVGPDEALYVLEHSQPLRQTKNTGRLVRINPDGQPETVVDGLNLPTAVVTGPDGALYIANGGNRTPDGKGEVLRVELPRAGLHLLGSGRIV